MAFVALLIALLVAATTTTGVAQNYSITNVTKNATMNDTMNAAMNDTMNATRALLDMSEVLTNIYGVGNLNLNLNVTSPWAQAILFGVVPIFLIVIAVCACFGCWMLNNGALLSVIEHFAKNGEGDEEADGADEQADGADEQADGADEMKSQD